MIEVTLLIPVVSNDGHSFLAPHHAAFERFILDRFGGFSRLPQTAEGVWRDDGGTTYRDETIAYVIAVDGVVKQGGALREVIDHAKAHYQQLAIYVRYLGQAEII